MMSDGKRLQDLKQENDRIKFLFYEDFSGCYRSGVLRRASQLGDSCSLQARDGNSSD